MLDPDVVKEFLEEEIAYSGFEIPPDIEMSNLVAVFIDYVEDDYYE